MNRIACQRLKQDHCSSGAKSIDDTKWSMPKSTIQHRPFILIAEYGTFKKVSKKTEQEKTVYPVIN